MSQITSNNDPSVTLTASDLNKPPKTLQQYSRNIKKLKLKLKRTSQEIHNLEKKIKIFQNTSNDKMLALKLSKYCRERKITPQMVFRFVDRGGKKSIQKEDLGATLRNIGIKFSQNQFKRLEYLLDEDLSGEISWQEYNHFLYAFGIKSQYTANQAFLKDTLKKLDINKILGIAQQQKKKKKGDSNYRQLLNYQQFIKYCHRHFPALKNKQIASIFNRLQKNGVIDVQDFLEYIRRKNQEEEKLKDKNKVKGKDGKQVAEDQSKTLKGIIKALLKHRPKDRKLLFHSSEFLRLQKILDREKGQLVTLFKQIDKKKKGSFGFNQLIQYFILHCLKPDMVYAYQLMGRKACLSKQKPQDIIRQYNNNNDSITTKEFINYCSGQYQLNETNSQQLWKSLAKQQTKLPVRIVIDAMKLDEGQKKIVYIKPSLWDTKPKDFFMKGCFTIFFNPFVALRGCISIMEELNKEKQHFWDDFEFGPTFQDPSGIYSIGMNIPENSTKWITVNSLQMDDFYYPTSDKIYKSSPLCTHQMFPKSLALLINQSDQFLWYKKKIDYNIKKVQQQNLLPLFEGLYPIVFHSFAKYGIYVFKFFVKEKWIYVLIDNKIPCNSDGQPLFSCSYGGKLSWIALIQKAYAKVKGSYQRLFEPGAIKHYIHQLTRTIPLQKKINSPLTTQKQKDSLWTLLNQSISTKNPIYSSVTQQAVSQLTQNNIQTGLLKNFLYKIETTLELPDKQCNNSHKSHRLILYKSLPLKNQSIWNASWHIGDQKNKFDIFQDTIQRQLKTNKSKVDLQKNCTILNYKLFRTIFNSLFSFRQVEFQNMIILRKIVQFQEKFCCKYEINCTQNTNLKKQHQKQLTFIVSLSKIKCPRETNIILKLKNQKNQLIDQRMIKNYYGNQEFVVGCEKNYLELGVENWVNGQQHVYSLTLYIMKPRYHLKQLDRQILFKNVSPYQEACYLDIGKCADKERKFIYRNFYKAAERGTTCCG